jgi:hypothetical protein
LWIQAGDLTASSSGLPDSLPSYPSNQHATILITSAEYRQYLPSFATGEQTWTERSTRELKRIPDKKEAPRVANKITMPTTISWRCRLTSWPKPPLTSNPTLTTPWAPPGPSTLP